MKRLLLAILILTAGTGVFCATRSVTGQIRRDTAGRREAVQAQTQLVEQAEAEHQRLEERVKTLKHDLAAQNRARAAAFVPAGTVPGPGQVSPEESEELLAELGFSWSSSGDYLIVSKKTLQAISLEGGKGAKLTDAACGVLAITPGERAKVEALMAGITSQHAAWLAAHAQRNEPEGDVVAKYELPVDAAFSQGLSNAFTAGVMADLGPERGALLLGYSQTWMNDAGMNATAPTILTVKRYPGDSGVDVRYSYRVESAGGTMSTDVHPLQFPEAFRPLFPNGWPDVAKREGFELPRSFNQNAGLP